MVAQAGVVHELYRLATSDEERKDVLRQVFARIVIRDRKIDRIEYHTPFDLFLGDVPSDGSRARLEEALLERIAQGRQSTPARPAGRR